MATTNPPTQRDWSLLAFVGAVAIASAGVGVTTAVVTAAVASVVVWVLTVATSVAVLASVGILVAARRGGTICESPRGLNVSSLMATILVPLMMVAVMIDLFSHGGVR